MTIKQKIRMMNRTNSPSRYLRVASGYPAILKNTLPSRAKSITVFGAVGGVGDKTTNLLPITAIFPQTINGVKFELINGKIVCNGTATANATLAIGRMTSTGNSYWCKGSPSGGSTSTYRMFYTNVGSDTGNGVRSNVTANTTITANIYVYEGYTCNNLVFAPIVTTGGYATVYEPCGYRIPITFGEIKEAINDRVNPKTVTLYSNASLTENDSITINDNNTVILSQSGNDTDVSVLQDLTQDFALAEGEEIKVTTGTANEPRNIEVWYYSRRRGDK